jgi:hypothetical protein
LQNNFALVNKIQTGFSIQAVLESLKNYQAAGKNSQMSVVFVTLNLIWSLIPRVLLPISLNFA